MLLLWWGWFLRTGERWSAAQTCLRRRPKPRKGFHLLTLLRFAPGKAILNAIYQLARIARVMSAKPSFTGAMYSACAGSSTAGKVKVADVSP